jgi:molecular chaperone DnaJ
MARTHYEVLGVLPTATPDEIKVAYRIKARQTHPDSSVVLDAQSSQRMADLSQAWRVLSDRTLRMEYDRSLLVGSTNVSFNIPGNTGVEYEPIPVIVRREFPWKMIGWMLGIGIVAVLLLNILSEPALPSGPDGLISGGSCVVIDANQLANEVACDQPHYGVARTLVGFDMTCPTDTQPFRDRQGMGIACVDPD